MYTDMPLEVQRRRIRKKRRKGVKKRSFTGRLEESFDFSATSTWRWEKWERSLYLAKEMGETSLYRWDQMGDTFNVNEMREMGGKMEWERKRRDSTLINLLLHG